VNITKTKKVVEAIFGNTNTSACKKLYGDRKLDMNHYPFGVHVMPDKDGTGCAVAIGFKGYAYVLKFTISLYPACCGIAMFHHFSVDESRLTQQEVDSIMEAFVNENKYRASDDTAYFAGRCNRLEVIMVETRDGLDHRTTDPDIELEPVENPIMRYKPLWNFFHKYARKVRTRLQYNKNSGNVLHNMEVLF
jgi:hypothetical protein